MTDERKVEDTILYDIAIRNPGSANEEIYSLIARKNIGFRDFDKYNAALRRALDGFPSRKVSLRLIVEEIEESEDSQ